jgi:hypothetical protein
LVITQLAFGLSVGDFGTGRAAANAVLKVPPPAGDIGFFESLDYFVGIFFDLLKRGLCGACSKGNAG